MSGRLTRRQFLAGAGGAAITSAAFSGTARAATARPRAMPAAAAPSQVAATYYELLLRHTNWVEQQWDASAGYFSAANYNFAVVLGNAVLLTQGDYDATAAGVSAATLHDQTIATITHFAASNVLAGGSEWGEVMFFDSTFELYFVLAARLLWDDLDAATQANIGKIATGQAVYTTALGTGNDPRSPGWTPNGLSGGWQGDTKVDEMAVYAQCLGPALAWYPDNSSAATWQHWLDLWLLNDTGLPAADRASTFQVDGAPISQWNTAHNIFGTFIVENHGSFEPHYQMETWRMSARVAAHFITAGRPVPTAVTAKPNGRQLWNTIRRVMSDSGEPFMPMDNDRYHLFGRDVIPLAFLAQVLGDPHAARAEANMAAELVPYQQYPPQYQLTKFSGEAKYEPEARAELAISYLFHQWRAQSGTPVTPVSDDEFFTEAAGATDYGAVPGLLAQCTPAAFAATVSKPGFVKFLYLPGHDDWLFDVSSSTPFLLPSTGTTVTGRSAVAYNGLRDGFDGTAALLTLATGHAGYATLPTGTAVYATSGNGAGEGSMSVFNLEMPGISGLNGQRTYTGSDGAVTIKAGTASGPGTAAFTFPARTARYVRMQGVKPATQYGYSIYELSVYGPGSSTDLAVGKTTTASSYDDGKDPAHPSAGYPIQNATDGNPNTRWAVSVPERSDPASWLEVDLGAPVQITGVTIVWEAAYGAAYKVQTSLDSATWSDAAAVPDEHQFQGNWLNVDGRAGFVVSGSSNPITATANQVTLSDGPATGAAGMVIEAYAQSAADTRSAAARPGPSGGPAALAASTADEYLSLFNLSSTAIGSASVTIPQDSAGILLYRGTQVTATGSTVYEASLAAATASVEPPRFTLSCGTPDTAGQPPLPAGLRITVADSHHVSVSAPAGYPATRATMTALASGQKQPVMIEPGGTAEVQFQQGRLTPSPNLALARTTYPTSPLPDGMSDPANAVDGEPSTAWRPGPGGRMVVDLGSALALGSLELTWGPGSVPAATVSVSNDGLSYTTAGTTPGGPQPQRVTLGTSARYVSVSVPGWSAGNADLTALSVTAAA